MSRSRRFSRAAVMSLSGLLSIAVLAACSGDGGDVNGKASSPDGLAAKADVVLATGDDVVATVDPRFQSYNIEMVEVTGGEFWTRYDSPTKKVSRPPIELSSERLRNLARALGPTYIRVSGSWANSTYFDVDGTTGGKIPEGYIGVLTPEQWLGVSEFAKAVDGKITTSFAWSPGTRDATGKWSTDQARALLRFSASNGVPLAAVEVFNEPNLPVGVPEGFTAKQFAQEADQVAAVVDEEMPEVKLVGPGTTSEVVQMVIDPIFTSADVLKSSTRKFDVFSYHFYPKVSERCASPEGQEVAFTSEFLGRVDIDRKHYRQTRDELMPKAPMWVTETAEAACGGDRWAATFRDVFRYVDSLGRLADDDGSVVFHNTLAASDYGLLDEDGFVPRPNYWAAVLWARLMGPETLALSDPPKFDDLGVYAHCTASDNKAKSGSGKAGLSFAVVNTSQDKSRTVATPSGESEVYLLTSDSLDSKTVMLNGEKLTAAEDGTLPEMEGKKTTGAVEVPPMSVAFVVDRNADTPCI